MMTPAIRVRAFVLALSVGVVVRADAATVCGKCTSAQNAQTAFDLSCSGCVVPGQQITNFCPAVLACLGGGSTTTTIATTTTTLATTTTVPATVPTSSGMLYLGKPCDDLPGLRGVALRANQTMCGRNGDFYYPASACTTGTARPLGLPFASAPGLLLPAGALVYPGWGGWANMPWVYRTAAACQWGAKDPVWCSTAGCTVASGTCTAVAQAGATITTVADGTCSLVRGGGDCCSSSWMEGVGASVVAGNGFPNRNLGCANGDNSQRCAFFGRRPYGSRDEGNIAFGGGAMTGGPDAVFPANPLHPGWGIIDAASIAVASMPPPVVKPVLAGTATGALVTAVGWGNTHAGGSPIGPAICTPVTNGGLRLTQPERDGWTWPVPYPDGETMAKVFFMWLPSCPCTPYPGQTQCEVLNPDQQFFVFADYLQGPTDYLDFTSTGTPEHESPPDTNDTGVWPLAAYDATIGFGACTTGQTGIGWPCTAPADTGYLYAVFSTGNDAACKHGKRGGFPVNVTSLPTVWRTDVRPFCGADGVAWQRLGPHGVSVVHQLLPGTCSDRYANRDGTFALGICTGADGTSRVEFYKPGTLQVTAHMDATGVHVP